MIRTSPYANKLILITGASSGIGRALAIRFAEEGALLALVARNEQQLQQIAEYCRKMGAAQVTYFVFDLIQLNKIQNLIQNLHDYFGRTIDLMLHAAGIGAVGLIDDMPLNEICDTFSVNLLSAMILTKAILPTMKKKGEGKLIFITSGVSYYGVPTESIYSATKAGLERFVEGLELELMGSKISTCLISPGPVETLLMRRPRMFGRTKKLIGRPKIAEMPEVIANKIVERLQSRKRYIELSCRSRLVRHMVYWMPSVLRQILFRQFKQVHQGQN